MSKENEQNLVDAYTCVSQIQSSISMHTRLAGESFCTTWDDLKALLTGWIWLNLYAVYTESGK